MNTRPSRWQVSATVVLAGALLGMVVLQSTASTPAASPEPAGGAIGALLHSRWLHPDAALGPDALAAQARAHGLRFMPVGIPLADAAARAAAPETLDRWLRLTPGLPAVPSFNTFALPSGEQDRAGLEAFFARVAPALDGHGQVVAVAGANEPWTKGKAWPSAAAAEARIRAEHEAWRAVSDAPFCHKFTNPNINVAGADWARLQRVWAEAQDAICYDWYASNGDTLATLDMLRDLGASLGKPVFVLEVAVPGNDPALLHQMAQRVDAVAVYQWLTSPGGEDEAKACYVLQEGAWVARPPATMLRAALQAPR